MGIFIRPFGLKNAFPRAQDMFGGDGRKYQSRKNVAAAPAKSKKSSEIQVKDAREETSANDANDGDASPSPHPQPSTRPKHSIPKQTIKAKILNPNQPTQTAIDKQQSTSPDGNVEPSARFGWKAVSSKPAPDQSDVIAQNAQPEFADDLEASLEGIERTINLCRSDIASKVRRMMTARAPKLPTDPMAGGENGTVSPHRNPYITAGMQQQPSGGCQCCYHEENHHYEYDSHHLPGKLLNFIVLIAIFLHYAIIAFIEPNYSDWFIVICNFRRRRFPFRFRCVCVCVLPIHEWCGVVY